ncbi:YicC/YloC family endoribonuclease [Alkalimarinus sediminis]|uniref:YicC family protein n=1 Tax=Alkalimarinus sediminis TaxID=1632866 RepID=A0A9E8KQW7_9ALTE|nr:YicC/YloC family endoribonuclease [Alkalimarinus sediminis]UZW75307.1 YicC family protein [Alkalimarinus sediminis]
MIQSMTAFAREASQGDWGTLTWEIRSVNHRYLEPHFKLPENLREIEPNLREGLRKHLNRGKVECALRWQPAEQTGQGFDLNIELVEDINQAANQVNRILDNPAHLNALELLQWPGVMKTAQVDAAPLKKAALDAFDLALKNLVDTRTREGEQLKPLFDQRLDATSAIVNQVREKLPAILSAQRENILARFEDAKLELDAARVEQEMVMLAQKTDVAEELDRLDAHVKEVRSVLNKKGAIGRRLDFLMQELNREANTLSSKSIVTDTTKAAVELKVLIEQMREQVQNIE